MDTFLKIIGCGIITVIITIALPKQHKDISTSLTIAVCCMVAVVALTFLAPVVDFVNVLTETGNLNTDMVKTLLKAVGISLLSEFVIAICADSGNAALGKMIQLTASALLLSLSIPFLTQLLEILSKLLTST